MTNKLKSNCWRLVYVLTSLVNRINKTFKISKPVADIFIQRYTFSRAIKFDVSCVRGTETISIVMASIRRRQH